jgi:hypothetical protein
MEKISLQARIQTCTYPYENEIAVKNAAALLINAFARHDREPSLSACAQAPCEMKGCATNCFPRRRMILAVRDHRHEAGRRLGAQPSSPAESRVSARVVSGVRTPLVATASSSPALCHARKKLRSLESDRGIGFGCLRHIHVLRIGRAPWTN